MAEHNHYFSIEESRAYKIATEVAELVWIIVQKWPWFAKKTLGIQWIESTDSISANLVEGFGRFHKKDRVKFYSNTRWKNLQNRVSTC